MAAGATYTLINAQTANGSVSTINFTSISQTYTDLILKINSSQSGNFVYMRVGNGSIDSGTNYSEIYELSNGSSVSASGDNNSSLMPTVYVNSGSNYSVATANFMNYSNTTTFKTVLNKNGVTSAGVLGIVNLWRSTSAINTISVFTGGGNYSSGSTFALYGIAAA